MTLVWRGLTVNDERLEQVNFTKTYATGVQVIIVPKDSKITSADDLFADGANHNIEEKGLGSVERFNKGADAVMALSSGKVDCVVIDNEPAKVFVQNNPDLKILDTEYVKEDYAIAISKNNDELFNAVNGALEELIADGTVKSIIDKYIPAE